MSNNLHKLITEKNRLELTLNKLKTQQAKEEQTKILMQKGALLNKYLDANHLSIEETEQLLMLFSQFIKEKRPECFNKPNSQK